MLSTGRKNGVWLGALALFCVAFGGPALGGPVPIGTSTTTVSYTTPTGLQSFTGAFDYLASSPGDATPLASAPNIRTFNSLNAFGRRTFVAASGPQFAHVLPASESVIAHAFFKFPDAFGGDFFPGITSDSMVTLQMDGIAFDGPVNVDPSTIMLHSLWADAQVQGLSNPYFNLHNHEIDSANFRDFNDFQTTGVFSDFPVANYVLGSSDLVVAINGDGTNQLGLTVSFPYSLLEHSEETGQAVPGGLPAPHGFLEPFHFHVEYVVTPEPASLALLLPAILVATRRRKRSASALPTR